MKRLDDPWAEATPAEQAALRIIQTLIERREEAGLKRIDVSRQISSMYKSTLNQYESGEIASPGLVNLIQWADVLGYDLVLVPREDWRPWKDES